MAKIGRNERSREWQPDRAESPSPVTVLRMPRVSSFHGIDIYLYHDEAEHQNRPHFHARYAEHKASIAVDGDVLGGQLPVRQLHLVRKWADLHRDELLTNWQRARSSEELASIDPLP